MAPHQHSTKLLQNNNCQNLHRSPTLRTPDIAFTLRNLSQDKMELEESGKFYASQSSELSENKKSKIEERKSSRCSFESADELQEVVADEHYRHDNDENYSFDQLDDHQILLRQDPILHAD